MKLVVAITVYDGLELLSKCVENFKKVIDAVVICYQDTSNKGIFDPTIDQTLRQFSNTTTIVKYQPRLSLSFKENERRKHSFMIDCARNMGATHFIIAAVDHFYDVTENVFEQCLEYDTTFTKIQTYYKRPTWQITPMVPWVMPFVCRMYPDTATTKVANYPVRVDGACKINPIRNWFLFDEKDIVLHNYSNVRDSFEKKIKNMDSPMLWSSRRKQEIIDQFNGYNSLSNGTLLYYNYAKEGTRVREVPNYFNI